MAESGSRKRSRFDRAGDDASPRHDRRRSRSPHGSSSGAGQATKRERSPLINPLRRHMNRDRSDKSDSRPTSAGKADAKADDRPVSRGSDSAREKAAIAAAKAAELNATLMAKIKSGVSSSAPVIRPTATTPTAASPAAGAASGELNPDVYQQDGDYIKDIDINDFRTKYMVTKGPFQRKVGEETGCDITTRGTYVPDRAMATAAKPPLYLHITSRSKEGLDKAVALIEAALNETMPDLIDGRRFKRGERDERQGERDERGRLKWPEAKVPINREPIRNYNLRAAIVGHGGQNVKHIQNKYGCRVQIRGSGSGFYEADTNRESDEPMYLYVAARDPEVLAAAETDCQDLVEHVRQEYDAHKEGRAGNDGHGQQHRGNGGGGYGGDQRGGYGGENGYGGGQSYGDGGRYSSYGGAPGSGSAYGGAQSPPAATTQTPDAAAQPTSLEEIYAWVNYYRMYPDQDPYVAYGGYQTLVQSQIAQLTAAAQQNSPMPGAGAQSYGAPPPPPPPPGQDDSQSIPPPPPPGMDGGSYNNGVPPPPPPGAPGAPGAGSAPGYHNVPPPPGM